MITDFDSLRPGLLLAMLTLIFGISMGVLFGANEDGVKGFVAEGIATQQAMHDEKSESRIWRYAQRAHFHATGVSAFALVLILVTGLTSLSAKMKLVTASLIGVGSFYPLSWLFMFLLSPSRGRDEAHHALLTESITAVTVGSLGAGVLMPFAALLFGRCRYAERRITSATTA